MLMGCCGGKTRLGTMRDIAQGNVRAILSRVIRLPRQTCEYADDRIRVCQACEHGTWLTGAEWVAWAKEMGIKNVFAHLNDLTGMKALPVNRITKRGALLFCSLCKCYIPAKAFVQRQQCPIGKW